MSTAGIERANSHGRNIAIGWTSYHDDDLPGIRKYNQTLQSASLGKSSKHIWRNVTHIRTSMMELSLRVEHARRSRSGEATAVDTLQHGNHFTGHRDASKLGP